MEKKCGGATIIFEPQYTYVFAPGPAIHERVLKGLHLTTSEIAYVSKNINFIENAMCFLSGTIWVKSGIFTYQNASNCPDLVFDSLTELSNSLKNQMTGCFGEVMISPDTSIKRGYCQPVFLKLIT